jgi:hypothetical protein
MGHKGLSHAKSPVKRRAAPFGAACLWLSLRTVSAQEQGKLSLFFNRCWVNAERLEAVMANSAGKKAAVNSSIGFGLSGLGQFIGRIGDGAPLAASGVSTERLFFHGIALLITLAALVFFLRAFWSLRGLFGGSDDPKPQKKSAHEEDIVSDFDPDAIMARYLANRPHPPNLGTGAQPAQSFGRKSS